MTCPNTFIIGEKKIVFDIIRKEARVSNVKCSLL